MIRYLLDTSAVSESMRPGGSPHLPSRMIRLEALCAIPVIAISELRFGILRLPQGRRRNSFAEYLDRLTASEMTILPFDLAAAEWHAAERARLESLGQTPPFADSQIAAVAATRGLTLVTLNLKDFERFDGLRVEAW